MTCDLVKRLPNDVLHSIFSKLCLRDLGRASSVSKGWRAICMSMPFFNISYEEFLSLTPEEFENYVSLSTRSSIQEKDDAERLWLKVMGRLEETSRAHWEKHCGEWTSGVKGMLTSLNKIWFQLVCIKWQNAVKSQQGQKQIDFLLVSKEQESEVAFLMSLSKKYHPEPTWDWEFMLRHAKAMRELTILHPLRSGFVLDVQKAFLLLVANLPFIDNDDS